MPQFLKILFGGQNQFASGGLLLMIVGGIAAYLREIPQRLWYWTVFYSTMTVTVKDDDPAFVWVKEWFLEQKWMKRVRHVDLDTTLRNERIAMMPAPGKHWFWYRDRFFEVWFSRTDNTHERIGRRVESFTFRTVGNDRQVLQRFVSDVAACHTKRLGTQSWLYTYDDGWDYVEGYSARLLESVVLEPGEKELLVADIVRFRKAKQRYQTLGVPYHRGYLFYGPPGTGKTSLVSALGAHFGMSVYLVNLGEFTDRSLVSAINRIPAGSMILFEDIDCMKSSKSREMSGAGLEAPYPTKKDSTATGVTLSGLLNVLDGFCAPSGVIFVMTTNHVENLDAALLRPGRIDYKVYLGKASNHQKAELFRRFFPEKSRAEALEFVAASGESQTMAEFQGELLAMEQGVRLDQEVLL